MTLEEAKKRADRYQAAAQAIVEHYRFEKIFGSLGKFEYEGSYRYKLMVKPDIDAHVYADEIDKEKVADIARQYLLRDDMIRVLVMDHRIHSKTLEPRPGFPQGVYFGLRWAWEGELWNLDLWIFPQSEKKDPEFFVENWHKQLTPEQHDDILLLKHQLKEASLYNVEFHSVDVYRAVVNDGIKTVEEIKGWRKTHPFH